LSATIRIERDDPSLPLTPDRAASATGIGGAFDIRAFHDVVLGSGAVGLATLAGIVEARIEAEAVRAQPIGSTS
jgi:hypothetical protein